MPKVAVYNISGAQVGEIELADTVFGIEPNKHVLHDAVVMQLASMRQGTHKVKTRSEVSGGGRKPWKQRNWTRVKDPFVRHNGKAAVRYSVRHHAAMRISFLRKFAVWQSNPHCLPKFWQSKSSY